MLNVDIFFGVLLFCGNLNENMKDKDEIRSQAKDSFSSCANMITSVQKFTLIKWNDLVLAAAFFGVILMHDSDFYPHANDWVYHLPVSLSHCLAFLFLVERSFPERMQGESFGGQDRVMKDRVRQ